MSSSCKTRSMTNILRHTLAGTEAGAGASQISI